MKIGDMVEQMFGNILRRGMILNQPNDLYYMNQKYWIVAWFPHPDIPVKNNSIYKDSASEASLKVISSI
jgi:hypothetical protein